MREAKKRNLMDESMMRTLTEVEQRCKSNTRRLDRLEQRQDNLEALTQSIAVMQTKQEQIETDVGEIKTDVKALREKPGKWWDKLIYILLTVLVGALAGLITRGCDRLVLALRGKECTLRSTSHSFSKRQ